MKKTKSTARKKGPAEPKVTDRSADFERALAQANNSDEQYILRLYVTGTTPRSARAVQNIRQLCDEHLAGRYDLEVIDIYQQPTLAQGEQIIAAPTLVKKFPVPFRKFVGDLSNMEDVLVGLNLAPSHFGKH
jgi:circadian clock protein KaiB